MSTKYLGEVFDIHGGGMDLKFPHHECEIAQAQACNHRAPVRFWMHGNMLTMNGKKMSKSTGNNILPEEIFTGDNDNISKAYAPSVARFFMMQAHYRSVLDFSNDAIMASEKGYNRLMDALAVSESLKASATSTLEVIDWKEKCYEAMNDDFKTMRVFVFDVLGLENIQESGDGSKVLDGLVSILIDMRNEARENRDWALSDRIRDKLLALGIQLKDGKEGTMYSVH